MRCRSVSAAAFALTMTLAAAAAPPAAAQIDPTQVDVTIEPACPVVGDTLEIQVDIPQDLFGYYCAYPWPVEVDGQRITVTFALEQIPPILPPPCPSFPPFFYSLDTEGLEPGHYRVDVVALDSPTGFVAPIRTTFLDLEASTLLRLHESRFWISFEWTNPYAGDTGFGPSVPLTDRSGYFFFHNQNNPEVMVKILDGRAINGYFWLFSGGMTTVGYALTVMDVGDGTCLQLPVTPPACPTRTFVNPPFASSNFVDLQLFADPPPESSGAGGL